MHIFGGLEKNYSQSYYWFKKGADQGHDSAQLFLGRIYEYGNGKSKNLKDTINYILERSKWIKNINT